MSLITSSFLIIGTGVYFALSGASWGIWVAGVGVLDLLTLPFVTRMIEKGQAAPQSFPAADADPAATDPVDPSADPSYNPYPRED